MKIKIVILSILILFGASSVVAQTKTASPSAVVSPSVASPSAVINSKEIQNLRNKVESTVSELRKKNQKAIAGNVINIVGTTISIKTVDEEDFQIKIDDTLTKIYQINGAAKKEIKMSDITKDSYIIASGPLIDKTISANVVYVDEEFVVKSGKITEINTDGYFVRIVSFFKDTYTLDIETYTKMEILNAKTLALETTRFSKLKEGDTVHFVFKKLAVSGDKKEPNRYSALKLLVVPQEYFMK